MMIFSSASAVRIARATAIALLFMFFDLSPLLIYKNDNTIWSG
jgi:hypothetical protein